jgi:hypothetical protein
MLSPLFPLFIFGCFWYPLSRCTFVDCGEFYSTGYGKLASFFHIAIKKTVVKVSFQFFFITKGTHLKLWFTSF